MSSRIPILCSIILALSMLPGCQKPEQPLPLTQIEKDYDRPLPPGQFALRKLTDTSMYPRFGDAWYRAKGLGLREAVNHSLAYLEAPSSQRFFPIGPITHDKVRDSLTLFLQVLDQSDSPEMLDQLIRQNFDVYISVGYDGSGTVLFTGYYTPIFDGSHTRTEQFRFPLYTLPPEIEKDSDGEIVGGPWHSRSEIEKNHLLDGHELVWLKDRFEAYVVTVQGSGFIRLPDGTLYEIGYAGNNGQDYTPIGKMLVADGKIPSSKLSLAAMIRYFQQYPQELDHYLPQNKRYIFFKPSKGGPYGSLGKPVIAFSTIATDKEIFPRAALAFVDTRIPDKSGQSMRTFRGFTLDQDRGAAIRAPGRCDLYMGVGDEAGQRAGYTASEGRLFYLLAKDGITEVEPVASLDDDNSIEPGMGRRR